MQKCLSEIIRCRCFTVKLPLHLDLHLDAIHCNTELSDKTKTKLYMYKHE